MSRHAVSNIQNYAQLIKLRKLWEQMAFTTHAIGDTRAVKDDIDAVNYLIAQLEHYGMLPLTSRNASIFDAFVYYGLTVEEMEICNYLWRKYT